MPCVPSWSARLLVPALLLSVLLPVALAEDTTPPDLVGVVGTIWLDQDRDGVRAEGETAGPSMAGDALANTWTVDLLAALADGTPDPTQGPVMTSILTSEPGQPLTYAFLGIPSGSYLVRVANDQRYFSPTARHVGAADRDSDFANDPAQPVTGPALSDPIAFGQISVIQAWAWSIAPAPSPARSGSTPTTTADGTTIRSNPWSGPAVCS